MVLAIASNAWSQVPSQAQPGAVERSLEPAPIREPARIPDLIIQDDAKGAIQGAPGVTFTLKDVQIQGNTIFSSKTLRSLIAGSIGSTIKVGALSDLANQITQFYKKNGYILSRAYIPPQTIKDTVVIKVREGRLGDVEVRGNKRYSNRLIQNTLRIIHQRGAVNVKDLERGLLLLMDVPGLAVRATLKPGTEPGTTDIVIDASEDQAFHVGADYNNYGADVVSEHRFGASASATNLSGYGDLLSVRGVTGEEGFSGLLFGRAEYSTLLGYQGTRFGVFAQHLEYELQNVNFDYEGRTFAAGAWFSHPIFRTRQFSWWTEVGLDFRNHDQEVAGASQEDKVRPVHFENTFQLNDAYGGRNSFRLNAVFNTGGFMGGSDEEDVDNENTISGNADFNYFKVEAGLSRYQRLPANFGLILSASGQFTGNDLPSSEQFIAGGQGTVRGYDQAEFSGDNGAFFNAELRIPLVGAEHVRWPGTTKTLGETLQFALFVDGGFANFNDDREESDFGGAGAGLRFTWSPRFNLHFDYAHHIFGDDPQDEDVEDNGIFYIRTSLAY